ncbi:hypothetical protein KI659_15400 [Litoribacter alkaliphilus]|uniref:Lipocalin-like domain-containing protein n=1 Tax=Litoribacter ruber TaxID=702568 RepID=A0AAP2CPA0_9BACT|nr:hypothetical protein [Litoribacter alkaliphilus]MBS9525402.1 hypothetical protein [Litoribacter alkaliphilus]
MQIEPLLLFTCLAFVACQSNQQNDIVGSWTSVYVQESTGFDVTDRADFNSDGSYILTMYSSGDSVISELKGKYEIDKNSQTLTVTTNGKSFKHEIIEVDKDTLKIQTSQGIELIMKRIK